jgi:hypothetical protein
MVIRGSTMPSRDDLFMCTEEESPAYPIISFVNPKNNMFNQSQILVNESSLLNNIAE